MEIQSLVRHVFHSCLYLPLLSSVQIVLRLFPLSSIKGLGGGHVAITLNINSIIIFIVLDGHLKANSDVVLFCFLSFVFFNEMEGSLRLR